MQNTLTPDDKDAAGALPDLNADKDGRNKEWEDRARVNTEVVPEGTKTNPERDFEPENADADKNKDSSPAY